MDIEKRLELVKRETSEIITEKELLAILEQKKQPVVYHGFEPSGRIFHIGYIIGINKHIDFQKAGLRLKLLMADYHAWLNEKGSMEEIRETAKRYIKGFEALGVDIKKADVVFGSEFQLKEDYFTDIMKLSLRIRLLRARRSMTLIGREEEDPHISQLFYPLMQAIDIKHLKVDIAFGDLAQRKIHVLAREELPHLGYKAPIAIHHEFLQGLQGGKMSASVPASSIMIDDMPEKIEKKIKEAFCPAKQIKDNPILQICKFIILPRESKLKVERSRKFGGDILYNSYTEIEKDFAAGKLHPLDLKVAVAASLIRILAPVRKKLG